MKLSRILKSRDSWKSKARERGVLLRAQRRKISILQEKNQKLGDQILETSRRAAVLQAQLNERLLPISSANILKIEVRITCVMMFIMGIVPCNAVSRILKFLKDSGQMSLNWIPDPSSVVNWISRAGLGLLAQVCPCIHPWVAILDTSISFGKSKVLVVLRVPLAIMTSGKAPGLADVECIGLEIGEVWNGDTVCAALEQVFLKSGIPTVFLKDGGSDLMRGVSLLISNHKNKKIKVIQDVGHVIANLLKAEYAKNKMFISLIEMISSAQKKLRQTEFSSLRPPKLRTKGRFQAVSRLVDWADRMLSIIQETQKVNDTSLVQKLKEILPRLGGMRFFIARFRKTCTTLNKFQEILKIEGLNQATYQRAKKTLEQLPKRSKTRKKLMCWLANHLRIQCLLGMGQTPLLVSDDVIETLMGQLKSVLERVPSPEFTSMTLAVPLFCGRQNAEAIQRAIASCPHKMLPDWRSENCNNTHRKQRQRYLEHFQGNPGPKTVHIECS